MSRSYRKTSITGITTAASEKRDKQVANRRLRRKDWSNLQDWTSLRAASRAIVALSRLRRKRETAE